MLKRVHAHRWECRKEFIQSKCSKLRMLCLRIRNAGSGFIKEENAGLEAFASVVLKSLFIFY